MISPGRSAEVAEELARVHEAYRGRAPSTLQRLHTWEMRAAVRRASLRRIVAYRKLHRLVLGSDAGWAPVILNLLHYEHAGTSIGDVNRAARDLGLLPFDHQTFGVIAGGIFGRRLIPAAQCGALIGLRSFEREGLRIRDIDAVDEPAADRRRRKAAERQRTRREALNSNRPLSERKQKPWLLLGISERTFRRRKAAGLIV